MTDTNRHFDNEPDLRVSAKFSEDLGKLFAPSELIPVDVDRAVAETARRHLKSQPRRRWWVKWTVPATAAAAILLAVSIWWSPGGTRTPAPSAMRSDVAYEIAPQVAAREGSAQAVDVDRNGKVNILDAFALARHIEARGPVESMWDLNGDGLVDRRDVDTIALAAVRLRKGV